MKIFKKILSKFKNNDKKKILNPSGWEVYLTKNYFMNKRWEDLRESYLRKYNDYNDKYTFFDFIDDNFKIVSKREWKRNCLATMKYKEKQRTESLSFSSSGNSYNSTIAGSVSVIC